MLLVIDMVLVVVSTFVMLAVVLLAMLLVVVANARYTPIIFDGLSSGRLSFLNTIIPLNTCVSSSLEESKERMCREVGKK